MSHTHIDQPCNYLIRVGVKVGIGTLLYMIRFHEAAFRPENYQHDTHGAILEQVLHLWLLTSEQTAQDALTELLFSHLTATCCRNQKACTICAGWVMYVVTRLAGWLCSCSPASVGVFFPPSSQPKTPISRSELLTSSTTRILNHLTITPAWKQQLHDSLVRSLSFRRAINVFPFLRFHISGRRPPTHCTRSIFLPFSLRSSPNTLRTS